MDALILIPILFPIVAGAILPLLGLKDNRKGRQYYVAGVVIANMVLTVLICSLGDLGIHVFSISKVVSLYLRVDDMSRFFVILTSFLWLCATFYTFEYIKHEGNDIRFFTYFLMTLGVLIGLGFAANYFSFYMFYELMTIITYPLVIHSQTPEAMKAGSKYLMFSFVGASFALIGFIFISYFGTTMDFTGGGVLDAVKIAGNENLLLVVYLFIFIGFGGKAGMWPLQAWLPTAHPVAPAPASALLSGVITKAGVMGIIRVTFYLFGVDFIVGSWVQTTLMIMTLFTVFMGSMLAYKEKLLKKRLAYSTVSQVSYVLFGLISLTPESFLGALLHIVFHALIKNILFLSAGVIIYRLHKTYVYQLKGIGKTMPITMWCFTIASLALVGIPPTAGFVSKWFLGVGAMSSVNPILGTIGAGVLLISALLTGGYLITIAIDAFFPGPDFDYENMKSSEPNKLMTVPLIALTVVTLIVGMYPGPLINFIEKITVLVFG